GALDGRRTEPDRLTAKDLALYVITDLPPILVGQGLHPAQSFAQFQGARVHAHLERGKSAVAANAGTRVPLPNVNNQVVAGHLCDPFAVGAHFEHPLLGTEPVAAWKQSHRV